MNINSTSVLVTGGAGFIGSHIVDSLVKKGAKVTVYDNLSFGTTENLEEVKNDINFIEADILDKESLEKAMRGIDVVSHQAAQLEIFLATSNAEWDLRVNTIGTLNVLETAKKFDIYKVINASSACVYGQKQGKTAEEDHRHPNWTYGVSKLAAEEYGKIFNDYNRLPTISLRYSIVYGEREWFRRALPIFIQRAIQGEAPVVFGDGSQLRDFIHVSDVVTLHNNCIINDNAVGEFFNVSTGIGTSIRELAQQVTDLFLDGRDVLFENLIEGDTSQLVKGKKRNSAELKSMILSPDKATRILDWSPTITLKEGLQREYVWALNNQHRWKTINYTEKG